MKYIKLGWDIPIFGKGDRIELWGERVTGVSYERKERQEWAMRGKRDRSELW
jgi:hypothetical protein